jgi:PAS domain S-box-containing protein
MLGRAATELVGSAVSRFVAPHERHSTVSLLRRKITGQAELVPFERTYLRPDGTPVRVTIHERRIIDEHGKIVGLRSALLEAGTQQRSRPLPLEVCEDGIAAVS